MIYIVRIIILCRAPIAEGMNFLIGMLKKTKYCVNCFFRKRQRGMLIP